jgi:hypothetical protein
VSRRRRVVGALLVLLPLAGCSIGAEDHARQRADDDVPFDLLEPDSPALFTPPNAGGTESAGLCFIEDDGLVTVDVPLERPVALDDVVDALGQPPDLAGRSLRTSVGDPPVVDAVTLIGGIARVDLLPTMSDLGSDEQVLAIGQLVCALTSRPGVGQVSFTLDGEPAEVPRGDRSLSEGPVSRDDYRELVVSP